MNKQGRGRVHRLRFYELFINKVGACPQATFHELFIITRTKSSLSTVERLVYSHRNLVAVLTLSFEIIQRLSTLSKDEVSQTSTDADRQKQPTIVSHGNQHQEVGHTHLDNMKKGLQHMEETAVFLYQYCAFRLPKSGTSQNSSCVVVVQPQAVITEEMAIQGVSRSLNQDLALITTSGGALS